MISGIDFSGSKAQDGVTISGVVTNAFPGGGRLPNGSLWRQISLSLVPADEPLESRSTFYLKALKDNDNLFPFEIRSVPRGTYDLHATFMDSTWSKGKAVRYFSGKIRVVVSDEDLKGIRFEVETGIDVHGKLLIRDESAVPLSFESVAESQGGMEGVSFHSMIDNASLNPSIPESYFGSLENDGTFVLEALPSGRYEIDALTSILPFEKGKYCLQDIRQDGRSVFNDGVITVGRTAVSVQVDFNTGCTVVKGTVATSSEHRQFGVSVILVPELSHRANKALFKITSAGPDGSFTFEGVSSGNYKVFAFDANPRNEVMSFEFLSRYEVSGTPISATSGTEMQPLRVSLIHLVQ